MAPKQIATIFAEWGAELDVLALPAEVAIVARRALVDTVGVMTAGRHHRTTTKVCAAFDSALGSCSLVTGGTASAEAAALINGTAAHVYDLDDASYTGIMHTSAVIVPALLAALDESGADDAEALAGFVAGSEVSCVLADMATHDHYFSGWWSTSTFGTIGAVVAVARVKRLSICETQNAISLAAASAGGSRSIFGTDAKPFLVGNSARCALDFVNAARHGVTAPINIFDAPHGFFGLLNRGKCLISNLATLGQRWRLVDPGLLQKSFPICSAAHAAVEQTAKLFRQTNAPIEEIDAIECLVPELVALSLSYDDPQTPQEAQFSLPYAVACAVNYGKVRLQDISDENIHDKTTRAIMKRITTDISQKLSTDEMREQYPESAHIFIRLKDGSKYDGFCGEAYGMPRRPLSDSDIEKKFKTCADFGGVSASEAAFAHEALLSIGKPGIRTLSATIRRLWAANSKETIFHAPTSTQSTNQA